MVGRYPAGCGSSLRCDARSQGAGSVHGQVRGAPGVRQSPAAAHVSRLMLTDTLNEEDRDGLGEWDGVMVRSPGRSIVGMVALWWSSRRGNRWRVRASG